MGFADKYISRNLFLDSFIDDIPKKDLKIVVTIPVYNEPDILDCLDCLSHCNPIDGSVEVIIVINSSERDNEDIKTFNFVTYNNIKNWIAYNRSSFISFHVRLVEDLPSKHAGVGLARKIAMDEALIRFNSINCPDGIITGYDADTRCDANYFTSLIDFFSNRNMRGGSIYFEHPISGNDFSENVYKSSAYYELYLRYYIGCLRFIGHPHAFHCIGSSFAVRAKAYSGEGGMNKKQAGEDFYFLQKIISTGGYGDIVTTVLHPSSRLSDRTPFGTGRSIAYMCDKDSIDYLTYPFEIFLPLIPLFERVDKFYKCNNFDILLDDLSPLLQKYLEEINFKSSVEIINRNCSSVFTFRNKFYQFLNIFRVLKFLNYSVESSYSKESVISGACALLRRLDISFSGNDVYKLLDIFRRIDRK